MDFLELDLKRYSVRSFNSKPVEEELINKILEAGRIAPTAKNSQPAFVYVLKSEEALRKANEVSPCIFGAPLVFMICYDKNLMCPNEVRWSDWYGCMDTTIVTTHMMLEAADLGLGSCFVERFDHLKAHELFELPDNLVAAEFLPVGYPSDDAKPSERHFDRKALSDFAKEV